MDCDTAIHEAMGEYLEDGDVFIDVGANIGLFSILAASKFGAEVYAFEPSERELARLARNATLNEVAIKTFQVALGSVATVGSMHLEAAGNHMMNRVASGQLSGAGMARCEIRRLDEVLLPEIFRRARLVKIDVEGYEMNVLLGMSGAFEFLQHAALVVEITPRWLAENGSSADSLYEFVTARGWRPRVGLLQVEQWDEIFDPPSPLGRDGQLQMD
jgi:FkbM family methyltransferase